jgi:catechol 2,3-dioxygenase-like lactoylglutathione lyase family enzyme
MSQKITIERVDHIGIRVRDLNRALNFYRVLGFDLLRRAEGDDVAIVRNEDGVELNLIFNANAGEPGTNVLMAVSSTAGTTATSGNSPTTTEATTQMAASEIREPATAGTGDFAAENRIASRAQKTAAARSRSAFAVDGAVVAATATSTARARGDRACRQGLRARHRRGRQEVSERR